MDAFPEATPGTSGRSDQEALKIALINEKSSPEILMFQEDLVSRIEAQIDYQVRREEGLATSSFASRRAAAPPKPMTQPSYFPIRCHRKSRSSSCEATRT